MHSSPYFNFTTSLIRWYLNYQIYLKASKLKMHTISEMLIIVIEFFVNCREQGLIFGAH
ncbi:hypothetical protein THOG05_70167 [Vibrio rotiferianus]|nr:hypothetical protein THOG05_70167 [Vibrio rotiferianus]